MARFSTFEIFVNKIHLLRNSFSVFRTLFLIVCLLLIGLSYFFEKSSSNLHKMGNVRWRLFGYQTFQAYGMPSKFQYHCLNVLQVTKEADFALISSSILDRIPDWLGLI